MCCGIVVYYVSIVFAGFFGCTLEMFNGCQRKRLFLHGRYHSIHNVHYTLINNSFLKYGYMERSIRTIWGKAEQCNYP